MRVSVVTCSALLAVYGCANAKNDAASNAEPDASEGGSPEVRAAVDGGRGNATRVAAANFVVTIVDQPAWPESGTGSHRLGYLRAGSSEVVYDKPIVNEDCTDGWLVVVSGGYLCGRAIALDPKDARVRAAPKLPDLDAGLPYRYGTNVGEETPLYRRVLSAEDRKRYEPGLVKPASNEEASGGENEEAASTPASAEDERTASRRGGSSSNNGNGNGNAEPTEPSKPRLKDLKGRGVLVRKMAPGFSLALDREFKAANARWWRTTFGFAVPFERIMVQPGRTKHAGAWFLDAPAPAPEIALPEGDAGTVAAADAGAPSLTGAVGFVAHGAQKIEVNEEGTKATWGGELPKRSAVLLTGKSATIAGVTYHQTAAGFWVRVADLSFAKPQPPADLARDKAEKWIDVDLTRQMLVAFEGARPVFGTLISSGRRNPQDKEHDFPTPAGSFRIREKHVTTTMDGDVASDGPYSIEDVPWVMYFQGSYALHGAFWHDAFGHPRSHGCVNMSPEDARTLFSWTDPPLPDGWHGVFAKDDKTGTRVIVHEDKPPKRTRSSAPPQGEVAGAQ